MAQADNGWTKDDIINLINISDRAVERAVLAIYARQTDDEKNAGGTKHLNAKGFSGPDAGYGSYCARWVLKGRSLNGKHLVRCRTMMRRYHRQLREDANKKLARGVARGIAALVAFAQTHGNDESN